MALGPAAAWPEVWLGEVRCKARTVQYALPPASPEHAETFEEDLEPLVLADQLGFDEAWLGEHYTSTWENIPART